MSSQLFENTVCMAVTFHRAGKHRRIRRGEAKVVRTLGDEGKLDQTMFSVGKKIFESERYQEAVRIANDFDSWISKREVPSPLRRGTHLIPVKMLDETYAKLDEAQTKYEAKADALLAEYDELKRRAREGLGELYREEDYPAPDALRRSFWVERRMFDFSPPGEAKLSEAVFRQEQQRWSDTFKEAEEEVRLALRESCRSLVSHLADRLAPAANGKRKRLHESAVDGVVEFLELFDRRNVLNDDELKQLVDRARRILDGDKFLVDALRQDQGIRDIVRGQMEKIAKSLDALITSGPRRVVSFEED